MRPAYDQKLRLALASFLLSVCPPLLAAIFDLSNLQFGFETRQAMPSPRDSRMQVSDWFHHPNNLEDWVNHLLETRNARVFSGIMQVRWAAGGRLTNNRLRAFSN